MNLHQSAAKFLILVHKFVATPQGSTDILRSVVMQPLVRWLEGIKKGDLQIITKVCDMRD